MRRLHAGVGYRLSVISNASIEVEDKHVEAHLPFAHRASSESVYCQDVD